VTDEQLRLMVRLLVGLYAMGDFVLPYNSFGVNVGRCRCCGVVGKVCYPMGDFDIRYDHTQECLISQAEQLRQSLAKEPSEV
jgi:hypothetical protein